MFCEFHWISMILWVLNSSNTLWGCAAVPSDLGQGFFHLSALQRYETWTVSAAAKVIPTYPYHSLRWKQHGYKIPDVDQKWPNWCTKLEVDIGAELPTSAESWRSRLSFQVWKSLASLSCKDTWRTGMHGNAWQRHGNIVCPRGLRCNLIIVWYTLPLPPSKQLTWICRSCRALMSIVELICLSSNCP